MFYKLMNRIVKTPQCVYQPYYMKLNVKTVEKKGILSRVSFFEKFDLTQISNYHVNDFKISNILANGQYEVLKATYMPDTNPLTVIGQVDSVLKSNLPQSNKSTNEA